MAFGTQNMSSMFQQKQVEEPLKEVQEAVKETAPEPVAPQSSIYEFLESVGGPTKHVVEQWKQAFGGVNLLPINEDTVFIYRSLKRSEWNVMKAQFMQAGDSLTEDHKKEQIVTKCLLWPKIDSSNFALIEAGLIDTLYTAIETSSYFLAPQVVMNMIMRL